MKKVLAGIIVLCICSFFNSAVSAGTLNGEYTIAASSIPNAGVWLFSYTITNNNQGGVVDVGEYRNVNYPDNNGSVYFEINIPSSGVITNVQAPPPYRQNLNSTPLAWWEVYYQNGWSTIAFGAHEPAAVYPPGQSATFSFEASNVEAGYTSGVVSTNYWDGFGTPYYVDFDISSLLGPVTNSTVPEPATMLLLGFGLAGLSGVRRFSK